VRQPNDNFTKRRYCLSQITKHDIDFFETEDFTYHFWIGLVRVIDAFKTSEKPGLTFLTIF
jgi:hypothetical protein